MRVELGNVNVEEGKPEFAVTVKGGRTIVELPDKYIVTIFVMDEAQLEEAIRMYGSSVVVLERRGDLYLVIVTEDTKDSLECIFEMRFET